jgi:(2Fe-2S) ferredoxin
MGTDHDKLERRVRKARVDTMQRHVLVCTDCDKGDKRAKQLRTAVNEAKLRDRVTVTRTKCLSICASDSVCVVYPEGTWYAGLKKKAIGRLVEDHLRDGQVLEDAAFHVNRLQQRRDTAA